MSKEIRAERIKNVILENSTYEELAEKKMFWFLTSFIKG